MAKWLLVVETNSADAAREAEFNAWYDKIHLPDVLETPSFIKATRYEDTKPLEGKAKFLATYEIEADDIDEAMKVTEFKNKPKTKTSLPSSGSDTFYHR